MTKNGITRKQREVLQFIRAFIATEGFSPTVREIAQAIGAKSISGAHRHIQGLADRGQIVMRKGQARSIALVENLPGTVTVELPPELDSWLSAFASARGISPADVVVECVRDGMLAVRRLFVAGVSCETRPSSGRPAPTAPPSS